MAVIDPSCSYLAMRRPVCSHVTCRPWKSNVFAVAVVRGIPEHRHATIVLNPSTLDAHRHVAPDEILSLAAPRRPF
jgi:hypothetical protein